MLMQPGLVSHLRNSLSSLSGTELKVIEWVLENPASIPSLSIRELALACEVSESTVVRTCQRMGYNGFPEFRLAMAVDLTSSAAPQALPDVVGGIQESDDLATMAKKVYAVSMRSLQGSIDHLDMGQLGAAIDALVAARQIHVFASGAQSHLAEHFCARFLLTGIPCNAKINQSQQLAAATIMDPADVLVVFSHSGRMRSLTEATKTAKERGVRTIAITNFGHSPLASLVDMPLLTNGVDLLAYGEDVLTEVVQMAMVACLLVGVIGRRRETILPNVAAVKKAVSSLRV